MPENLQYEQLTPEESIVKAVGKPGLSALLDFSEAALDVVFGTSDKEGTGLMHRVQPRKVHVATVHHVEN